MDHMVLGGVAYTDDEHWKNEPKAGGSCKVYFSNDAVFLDWGGDAKPPSPEVAKQDHINQISANDFLTKDILTGLLVYSGSHGWYGGNIYSRHGISGRKVRCVLR